MSKKDYIAVARALHHLSRDDHASFEYKRGIEDSARSLIPVFKADNSNFNSMTFMEAVRNGV